MAGPKPLLFAAALALMAINLVMAKETLVPLRRGMPIYHSLTKRDAGLAFNDTTLLNTTNMLYGNPGNQSKFTVANMTMYTADHEMIIHSESFVDCLANVICTNNSIIMTFNDNLTLANTAQHWGWVDGNINHTIIFLADWPNCRAGLNPQPYRINNTFLDLPHFNITLFGPATSFQVGIPTFDVDIGAAQAQGVNHVDPATGNAVTTNLTRRASKKGTKVWQRGREALKRRDRSSKQSRSSGETLHSPRSVHKRSIFSKIKNAFKKVVNVVKNAVVAVANAVKDVAVDVYKTVVDIGKALVAFVKDVFTNPKAIGKDILHNLLTIGKDLFRDVRAFDKLVIAMNPLASLIHATISTTIPINMNYNFTGNLINKNSKLGDQHLSLRVDCTDCGTTGHLDITARLRVSLGGLNSVSFTVQPKDFTAFLNLRAQGSGYSSLAISYVKDYLVVPIPDLGFQIPKILDIGVFYVFSAGVGVTSFNGTFDIEAGFNATVANGASVTYDLFHLSNDHASGWEFDFEKRFQAKGTFGLTLNTLIINTLAAGVKVFDIEGCGGGIPFVAPLLSTNIEEDYNSQGNVCGNTPNESIVPNPNGTTNWSGISTQSNLSPGNGPSSSDMSSFNGTLPPVNIAMNATGPENVSHLKRRMIRDITMNRKKFANADVAKRFSAYGDSSAGPGPAMYPNQVAPSSESLSATSAHQSSTQSSSTQSDSSSTQSSSTQSSPSSTQSSSTQSQSVSTQSSSAQPPLYPGHQQVSPQSQSSSAETTSTTSRSSSVQGSSTQPTQYPGYHQVSSQLSPYATRQWNSSQSIESSSARVSGYITLPSGYPAIQSSSGSPRLFPTHQWNASQSVSSSSSQASSYVSRPTIYSGVQSSNSSLPPYPTRQLNSSQSVGYVGLYSSSSRLSSSISLSTGYPAVQTGGSPTSSGTPVQSVNSTQSRPGNPIPSNSTQGFTAPPGLNRTQGQFSNLTTSFNESESRLGLLLNGTSNSSAPNTTSSSTGYQASPSRAPPRQGNNTSLTLQGDTTELDKDKHRALFVTLNLCIVLAIGVGAGGGDVKVNFGINSFVPGVTPAVLVTMPKKRSIETEQSAEEMAMSYLESEGHNNLVKRLSHGLHLEESGHLSKRVEYQLGYAPVVVCKKLYATHCKPLPSINDNPFWKRDIRSNQWRGPGRPLRPASS